VIVAAQDLSPDGRRCLADLAALDGEVEILFVPDAEVPELPPGVLCLPSGPVAVGQKRQLALERARADVVALIDDDAYPHPTWLEHVLAALESDPGIGAVCGPTVTPPEAPELEQLSGRVYASWLVSGPQRWRYGFTESRDVDDAPSVNLAFRRSDALAVGFESPYYPGDDTIVCDRLLRRGRRIRYVPGAIVFHRRRPLWRAHLRQVWRFGRHRGTFARRFGGNSARPAYFAPSLLVSGLALGWLLPGRGRWLWRHGARGYLLACLLAGADPSPARWARISGAIAATHATYGVGFWLGLLGLPLDEHRER
jgi:hypothetical protein